MKKEDRKELLKKFTEVVYARTRSDFLTRQEELDNCETFEKYRQYQNYLEKIFGGRMESWALFSRELPTHDSNTTAYAEISMSVTKETQFVRMKSRSLPELLSVICDGWDV